MTKADRRVRHAWLTSVIHAVGSSVVLLATGLNVGLAAHYPLLSAGAVFLLGLGIRRGSRVAALLLLLAAATPAVIKLMLGVLHATDAAALPLSIMYARGLAGTIRLASR
ncbi:MAG TPA: hypothetical protein VK929_04410 [Longimicrobiales bacterium]|nr:hypothetical protein [Longimicrobiales bacterium]